MRANELSCKDLMIGDYVRHKKTKDIIKIFEINDRALINNEADGYCSKRNISIHDIEPIPLVSEILEKFEFSSESNIFGLQTYKLNENFNLENRGDKFCLVRKCRDSYSSTFWICDLTYLHQLQHALRLCEISIEIGL